MRRRLRGQNQVIAAPIVNPELARQLGLAKYLRKAQNTSLENAMTLREENYRRLNAPFMMTILEEVELTSAAFGIEPRSPFMDKRLVEFCLALPAEQKIRQGWTRLVLRNAMKGILPEKIQQRAGKSNLGPNFNRVFALYEMI